MPPLMIGVIGYDTPAPPATLPSAVLEAAEEIGSLIAQRRAVLVSGGRRGIMEAASRGAHLQGGIVVGLLPGESKYEANQYVSVPIATGIGRMRNVMIIRTCDAIIMIGGGSGTLNEAILAYGRKPLVVLEGVGGWAARLRQLAYEGKYLEEYGDRSTEIHYASTPREAVDLAFTLGEQIQAELIQIDPNRKVS